MADIVIVEADVIQVSGGSTQRVAGEAIAQGDVCYINSADSKFWLADNNDTAVKAAVAGIALNSALAGQPVAVAAGGVLGFGALLTTGIIYALSDTPGGITASAGLLSGMWTSILGVATSTTDLSINLNNSGAQQA